MLPILYLLTAIATATPVLWALQWVVWGAPKIAIEHISLVGSLIVMLAAVVSMLQAYRLANRLALIGALAVWFFYIPVFVRAVWTA